MSLFRFVVLCLFAGSTFFTSCASSPPIVPKKELRFATHYEPVKTKVRSYPQTAPSWVYTTPDSDDVYQYFIGISSESVVSEKEARSDALRNAVEQFVRYSGVDVSVQETIKKTISGQLSQGLDGSVSGEKRIDMDSDAFVSRIKAKEYYFEEYRITRNEVYEKTVYKYWVKASVPLDEDDRVRQWILDQKEDEIASLNKRVEALDSAHSAVLSQIDASLANDQPLSALTAISAEYLRLQTIINSDEPTQIINKAIELQTLLPGRAGTVSSQLILDSGRFNTIEIGDPQKVELKSWAWFRNADGALRPVSGLPLSLSSSRSVKIAEARTGRSGEAQFFVPEVVPGSYLVGIASDTAVLAPAIAAKLRNVSASIVLRQGKEGLPLAVKNTVRKLFDGAAQQQLVANELLIGSITYGDTARGSGFALDLKRQLNEQLTDVDGLRVIAPTTHNRQAKIENTIRTRGITAIAKGGLGAPATHAAVDGADAALNTVYSLNGQFVSLNLELKEAGSNRLLAVANGSFDRSFLPPGTDLVPTSPAQNFATPAVAEQNKIKLEVTSHLGDGQTYREDETISYFVNSDTDANLLLIYEDAEGHLIQILPNRYSGNAFYRKGSYIEVPDEADSERFKFTITGPFGLEHVWAFASTDPFPSLSGNELENGLKLLSGSFTSIRERLRASAQSRGSAYGEAHTMVTTVAK